VTDNTVELRLPLQDRYLPVLRATAGVVGGVMSFNYDEIMYLRVAIQEAFSVAMRWVQPAERESGLHGLTVRFLIKPGEMEVVMLGPRCSSDRASTKEDEESRAVMESLMDEVESGEDAEGWLVTRMVKRRQA